MLMAGLTRMTVELPVDGEKYEAFLEELAKKYGGKKTLSGGIGNADVGASFRSA